MLRYLPNHGTLRLPNDDDDDDVSMANDVHKSKMAANIANNNLKYVELTIPSSYAYLPINY